jgi:hypothetical protein
VATLTPEIIAGTSSDEELLKKLLAELDAAVPAELHDDLDEFVDTVRDLPPGLRAMASTYQFDVSMALDDLGWHFASWHHHGYAQETGWGRNSRRQKWQRFLIAHTRSHVTNGTV